MLNYLICPRANKRCKVTTFFSNGNDFQKKHSIREMHRHRVKLCPIHSYGLYTPVLLYYYSINCICLDFNLLSSTFSFF